MPLKKPIGKPLWQSRLFLFCLWFLAVGFLSASFGLGRTNVLEYVSINGDFQSYNVFRRMLAGQVPYVDFANYIGMAPILINLPFLFLGGSFSSSLFVTNFTCNVLFSLIVLLVFWLVSQNLPASLFVSAIFAKLVSFGAFPLVFGPQLGQYWENLFYNLFTPSNSMRVARMFWPFLLAFIFLLFCHFVQSRSGFLANMPITGKMYISPVFCAFAGFFAGLGLVWSSDFGLGVIFASSLLLPLILFLSGQKRPLFCLLAHFFGLSAGGFSGVFLATKGQPVAFFSFTAGVAQYQYFYFNGTGGRALLPYIFANSRLLFYTAGYVAFLLFCLVRFLQKRLDIRLFLAGFLALSVLSASYAYVLSGSGYNFTEALEGCFWLAIFAWVLKFLLWLCHWAKRQVCAGHHAKPALKVGRAAFSWVSLLAAAAMCFAGLFARDFAAKPALPENAFYVQALGGFTVYPKALQETQILLQDKAVFSLYATGLEAAAGQFQPTGYDYIIHALGKKAQDEYLAMFLQGQYPFVQTTSLGVEGWLSVQNWYIYRHILQNYSRVLKTEYSWIWQKTQRQSNVQKAQLNILQNGDYWEICIDAPADENFVADVLIDYDVDFINPMGRFLALGRKSAAINLQSPVSQQDVACHLPSFGRGYAIPIVVQNGTGKATIFAGDKTTSALVLHSAKIQNILPSVLP